MIRCGVLALGALLALGAAPATAEPPMWVVRDADSTIYLFGTVHLLPSDLTWRSERIDSALARADTLWLEITPPDDSPQAVAAMQELMFARGRADRPLSNLLTAGERVQLAAALEAAGLPPAVAEAMRPWLVAMLLEVAPLRAAGFDPEAGVEQVLTARARAEGDRLMGLETIEQQIGFLADLPETVQVQLLRETLASASDTDDTLASVRAWARGDASRIEQDLAKMHAQAPDIYRILVAGRNEDWARQIEALIAGQGVDFIATGAAHFLGPDSVLERLAARGLVAEPF